MACGANAAFNGRLYQIWGRNHNNFITFTYTWSGTGATAVPTQIVATTEANVVATLNFASVGGHQLLTSLVRPDGTTIQYNYDSYGNLSTVVKPAPSASGTVTEGYGFEAYLGTYILAWAASPRWMTTTGTCTNLPTDCGGYLWFNYTAGTALTNTTLSSILHYGYVDLTVPDGTGAVPMQTPAPTISNPTVAAFLTEYYTLGLVGTAATPTFQDTDGHYTNWVTDGSGRPLQTQECTNSSGSPTPGLSCTGSLLVTNEGWDANNNLTASVDARGNETDYSYDGIGNANQVGFPQTTTSAGTLRPTKLFDYDAFNNVVAYCDEVQTNSARGNWVAASTADNLCTSKAGGAGVAFTHLTYSNPAYEPNGELSSMVTPLGYTRHFAYNTAPQGGTDYGLPTDAYGDSITQADGTVRQPYEGYAYDATGDAVCFEANEHDATTFTVISYDSMGRELAVGDPDDASLTTASCSKNPGLPGSTIVSRKTFFPDGSVATEQSPSEAAKSVSTAYTYDPDGNEVAETHHFADVATTTNKVYDGVDRLVEVEQPTDASDPQYQWFTRYIYDLSQNATLSTATLNGTPLAGHGNLVKTVEYLWTPALNTNYSGGALSSAWTDVRGSTFDALDRSVSSYEAAFGTAAKVTNTYDSAGNAGLLYQSASAASQVLSHAYDSLGREVTTTPGSGDTLTPSKSVVYTPAGKIASITASDVGTQSWTYDANEREHTMQEPSGGGVDSPASLTYSYYGDDTSQSIAITSATFSFPVSLAYSYRADGKLQTQAETDGAGTHTFAWTYTGGGRVTGRTDPVTGMANGPDYYGMSFSFVPQTTTYDARGQVAGMTLPRTLTYSSVTHDSEGETTSFNAYNLPTRTGIVNSEALSYTDRGELLQQSVTAAPGPNPNYTTFYGTTGGPYAFGSSLAGNEYDFRSGQNTLQILSPNGLPTGSHLQTTHGYDGAGRMTSGVATASWANCPNPPPGTGSMTRAYDGYNRYRSETSSNFFTNPGTCATGPSYGNGISSMNYWPSGHPAQVVSSAGGIVQQNQTVHWDGDRPLFISFAGLPASAHIYLGTEGAIQLNGTTLTALDVFDRDWSGNMVTSHWVQNGIVGYSAWQQFSVKSPTPGGKGQISGTCYYPVLGSGSPPPGFTVCNQSTPAINYPYETNNESTYPIPRRDDGLELGEISIQGVRTMDVSTTQWTTPDAYAGDVHDPMSQRPFMWNRNNLYDYEDPTGYDSLPSDPSGLNPKVWKPSNNPNPNRPSGSGRWFWNARDRTWLRFDDAKKGGGGGGGGTPGWHFFKTSDTGQGDTTPQGLPAPGKEIKVPPSGRHGFNPGDSPKGFSNSENFDNISRDILNRLAPPGGSPFIFCCPLPFPITVPIPIP